MKQVTMKEPQLWKMTKAQQFKNSWQARARIYESLKILKEATGSVL